MLVTDHRWSLSLSAVFPVGSRRVFTIDPATARDLDDAIHIHRLDPSVWTGETPEYEVGVHIADVSHMLRRSSLTDDEARQRCTSV